jgi:hypothetical protein
MGTEANAILRSQHFAHFKGGAETMVGPEERLVAGYFTILPSGSFDESFGRIRPLHRGNVV